MLRRCTAWQIIEVRRYGNVRYWPVTTFREGPLTAKSSLSMLYKIRADSPHLNYRANSGESGHGKHALTHPTKTGTQSMSLQSVRHLKDGWQAKTSVYCQSRIKTGINSASLLPSTALLLLYITDHNLRTPLDPSDFYSHAPMLAFDQVKVLMKTWLSVTFIICKPLQQC